VVIRGQKTREKRTTAKLAEGEEKKMTKLIPEVEWNQGELEINVHISKEQCN